MLKNALFFGKSWKNRRGVALGAPPPNPRWPPATGALPPDPQVVKLFSPSLSVIFERFADFSASLKLQPIISDLSGD